MTDQTPLTAESARAAREAAGMTLRTAASLLHIDFTYLSKVENGHERPSDALLLRMSEVYGFDGPAAVLARKVAEVPPDVRAAIEAAAARRALEGSGLVSVEAVAPAINGMLSTGWLMDSLTEPAGWEGKPNPHQWLYDAIVAAEEAVDAALPPERLVVAVVDALMAEEVGDGHYRWQLENIVRPAILAALATDEEPREERCAVCGVGRWVIAHDPEAGPSYHPFTPEAR